LQLGFVEFQRRERLRESVRNRLGNLVDRLLFGPVTDFIDFRIWPVFNIADSSITISAVWLAILLWKQDSKKSASK